MVLVNIVEMDLVFKLGEIVIECRDNVGFDIVFFNSFGFGGINVLFVMLCYYG